MCDQGESSLLFFLRYFQGPQFTLTRGNFIIISKKAENVLGTIIFAVIFLQTPSYKLSKFVGTTTLKRFFEKKWTIIRRTSYYVISQLVSIGSNRYHFVFYICDKKPLHCANLQRV